MFGPLVVFIFDTSILDDIPPKHKWLSSIHKIFIQFTAMIFIKYLPVQFDLDVF